MVLERTLTRFDGIMLCVGMIIGSGIFSVPGLILMELNKSVGLVILMFVLGAIMSFFGVLAYCELGTMRPVSGGEKEYLEYAFPKSKKLFAFLFTQSMVWLMRPGACAADSISFGQFTIYSVTGEYNPDYSWVARVLAIFCISFTTIVHGYAPKMGIVIQDALTILKISLLILTIIIGLLTAAQVGSLHRADENFVNSFNSSGVDASSSASAFLQMSFAYDGWNNINYSLDELIDPVKSLPFVSLSSVSIVSFLYIFATVSFFLVVPVTTITGADSVIAADMFKIALGDFWGQRFMPFLIGLSSFGSVMCMAFGVSRVTLSAAQEGYFPFSFSSRLGKLNAKKGPIAALILNFCITLLLILVPSQSAYQFLVELAGYPEWIFFGISVFGLLYLRKTEPETLRPFKTDIYTSSIFVFVCLLLTIFPFIPPSTPSDIPYYLYPLVGLLWILVCIPWWYLQLVYTNPTLTRTVSEECLANRSSTVIELPVIQSSKIA